MRPIRKILVPTDFSASSKEAFRYAFALARATGASITVLHVARPPVVVDEGGALTTDPSDPEPRDLWRELREMTAEDPRIVVDHEVIVAHAPTVDHIVKMVETKGCDLIVIGTDGLSSLKHWVVGGVTEEVVRLARCPVMVVKLNEVECEAATPHTGTDASRPAPVQTATTATS